MSIDHRWQWIYWQWNGVSIVIGDTPMAGWPLSSKIHMDDLSVLPWLRKPPPWGISFIDDVWLMFLFYIADCHCRPCEFIWIWTKHNQTVYWNRIGFKDCLNWGSDKSHEQSANCTGTCTKTSWHLRGTNKSQTMGDTSVKAMGIPKLFLGSHESSIPI